MPLIFIVGSPGAGKSSVCIGLKDLGHEAYDTDGDGFAKWQNVDTGYIYPKSSVKTADRTEDFLKNHIWQVSRDEVQKLRDKADGKMIFLCGDIANAEELHDLFDTVFALYIDDETLKYRLANRQHNDWGKQPHELQLTLQKHSKVLDRYKVMNATVIDATQSLEQVVGEILAKSQAGE